MKKKDMDKKLKALGRKDNKGKTVREMRSDLEAAQADKSQPGHNIGSAPGPNARIS